MSARKEMGWVAVAMTPGVAVVILNHLAMSYVATWALTPGGPQAPLPQRILVAADNWSVRYYPFVALLAMLLLPAVVVLIGRRAARSSDIAGIKERSAAWAAAALVIAVAMWFGIPWLLRRAAHVPEVGPLATALVAWGFMYWALLCCSTPALVNGFGVLAAEGRLPRVSLVATSVLVASLSGGPWGLCALLLVLQAWLFAPWALLKGRPTNSGASAAVVERVDALRVSRLRKL